MRALGSLLCLALVGCGPNTKGGGVIDAPDPAPDGPDAPDAGPDASSAPCDLTKPFGAPTLVANINGTGRDLHAVLANELTLYMSSDRGGTMDVFTATRRSATGTWSAPSPLAGFSTSNTEAAAYLTTDELTMVYAGAPQGQPNSDIYLATRSTTSVGFSPGMAVTAVNTSYDDSDTVITGDGALLFFASNRPGTGGYDLYAAAKQLTGVFATPQPLNEINTAEYEAHPRVTADGLTLYYSSMRPDGGALGGTDIWTATRTTRSAPFGAPTRVSELNTTANESPTWVSPDGCRVLLQSNRAGGVGGQDIWEAVKPR